MTAIWIASNNAKKRIELTRLLAPLGCEIRTPADLGNEAGYAPVEDAPDFAGNARIKAKALARLAQGLAVGDDSGLCVDALDGRPGVHSARYGGEGLNDRDRLEKLLEELRDVPLIERTARFVCSLCVCDAGGTERLALEESCEGTLLTAATGSGGFGYDPIFVPREFDGDPTRSFAMLDAATKDRLSHRGKALRRLALQLPGLIA
ncbi:MAG: non-canonical purine NTP pyrophosphatase [Planctomycetes bacterium]|nr:non-canonical purine NTP pyrophosphatase [Planctomycetota bacterium]